MGHSESTVYDINYQMLINAYKIIMLHVCSFKGLEKDNKMQVGYSIKIINVF